TDPADRSRSYAPNQELVGAGRIKRCAVDDHVTPLPAFSPLDSKGFDRLFAGRKQALCCRRTVGQITSPTKGHRCLNFGHGDGRRGGSTQFASASTGRKIAAASG